MANLLTPLRLRALALAGAVIVLDQALKTLILTKVMDPPRVIEVLPVFNLVLVWNRGVSFGMLHMDSPWAPWILAGLALGVSALLVGWLFRQQVAALSYGIGLILGGALGNALDRLVHGAVVDFLDAHWGDYHWPAFNLADSAITLGAGLLILDSLFHRDKSS